MSNTLVVGSRGFIGSRLMNHITADEMDLKLGKDFLEEAPSNYKYIVMLACDQLDIQDAYLYNIGLYKKLDGYLKINPNCKVIFASSAAVYNKTSKYAMSKITGEAYIRRYKNYTILRFSNVYGDGDGHGAPDRFLRGENTINGDGRQMRDLVYVETVVDEIIKSFAYYNCQTLNVSTGTGTSVNEMFKLFGRGKPVYDKDADFGVFNSVLKPGLVND